jgi:6-phosphogluconolactonase
LSGKDILWPNWQLRKISHTRSVEKAQSKPPSTKRNAVAFSNSFPRETYRESGICKALRAQVILAWKPNLDGPFYMFTSRSNLARLISSSQDYTSPTKPRWRMVAAFAVTVMASALTIIMVFSSHAQPDPAAAGTSSNTPPTAANAKTSIWVYVGGYTGEKSRGIMRFGFDSKTGALTASGLAVESKHPSFLAVHPNGKTLYAANEIWDAGPKGGAVSAFSIENKTGKVALLNQQQTGGAGACFVAVDPMGKYVVVANYAGSVASFPLQKDGSLGAAASMIDHVGSSVNPQRQSGPHAHSITPDASGNFAIAADLGLDKLLVYRVEAGALKANDPAFAAVPPGSGPRILAFHPKGNFAYVINEMLCTVTALSYDAKKGVLREVQTISALPVTLPPGQTAEKQSAAHALVHPSGKFLYASVRGVDSIALFRIGADGKLTLTSHQPSGGKTPRHFNVDPSGRFLIAANQDSNNLVVFSIDPKSGELRPTGHRIESPNPTSVQFVKP